MDTVIAKSGYPKLKDRFPYRKLRGLNGGTPPVRVAPPVTTTTSTTPVPTTTTSTTPVPTTTTTTTICPPGRIPGYDVFGAGISAINTRYYYVTGAETGFPVFQSTTGESLSCNYHLPTFPYYWYWILKDTLNRMYQGYTNPDSYPTTWLAWNVYIGGVAPAPSAVVFSCFEPPISTFEFFAFSDERGYAGPDYDTGEYFAGAVSAMAVLNPNTFSIVVGDSDPVSATEWTINKYFGSAYPWFNVVGNHEAEDIAQMRFLHNFNPSGNTLPYIVNVGPSGGVETSYSFDYGNCHFVVINEYYAGEEAYQWPLGLLYVDYDQTQYGGIAYENTCPPYVPTPVPVSGYPTCVYVEEEGSIHPPYGGQGSVNPSAPPIYAYHAISGTGNWQYQISSWGSNPASYTLVQDGISATYITKAQDANNFGHTPGNYWFGNVNNLLFNWLSADLAATTKEHIFVFGHEPAYPDPDMDTGYINHFGDSLDKPSTSANRDRFWNLLSAYGVELYFCGHTHAASFEWPVSTMGYPYELDTGHAMGIGQLNPPSTFVRVGVTGINIQCDFFRLSGGSYQLLHTFTLPQTAAPVTTTTPVPTTTTTTTLAPTTTTTLAPTTTTTTTPAPTTTTTTLAPLFTMALSTTNGAAVSTTQDSLYNFELGDQFSAAIWLKGISSIWITMLGKHSGIGSSQTPVVLSQGWWIGQSTFARVITYAADGAGNTIVRQAQMGTLPEDGNWHHLVGTWDLTAPLAYTKLKIYVDGTEVVYDYGAMTGTLTSIANTKHLVFGQAEDDNGSHYFTGSIDEAGIWNRILSPSEVTSLYASGTGVYGCITESPWNSGFVAGFHFDEGTGTNFTSFGNPDTGTFVSPTGNWVSGKVIPRICPTTTSTTPAPTTTTTTT